MDPLVRAGLHVRDVGLEFEMARQYAVPVRFHVCLVVMDDDVPVGAHLVRAHGIGVPVVVDDAAVGPDQPEFARQPVLDGTVRIQIVPVQRPLDVESQMPGLLDALRGNIAPGVAVWGILDLDPGDTVREIRRLDRPDGTGGHHGKQNGHGGDNARQSMSQERACTGLCYMVALCF